MPPLLHLGLTIDQKDLLFPEITRRMQAEAPLSDQSGHTWIGPLCLLICTSVAGTG